MSDDINDSVVFLSGDLIFTSRVRGAAEHAGFDFRGGASLPQDQTDSIKYVVLELSTRSGLTGEIVDWCAQHCPQAKLMAYGPHVQVNRLDAARAAGITNVMTRGQFDRELPRMFAG